LACFAEQWLRFVAAVLRGEPFGVLELGDGEVEGEAELAAEGGGAAEAVFDLFVVAAGGVQAGAQPGGVRVQEGGELTGLERLGDREQLLCFVEVGERQRGLGRLDQGGLDARVGDPKLADGLEWASPTSVDT